MIRLHLLGAIDLRDDSGREVRAVLAQPKRLALLAYLAAASPRGSPWVHNTPMLEGVEKAVLRHPLTITPKPARFPSHRTAHTLMGDSPSWRSGPVGPGFRESSRRRCEHDA